MVREKYLENEIFSRSGKSQGILWMAREIWKVREKSGDLKKNGFGRQSSENLFCSRRERMYFLRESLSPSPSSLGGYY